MIYCPPPTWLFKPKAKKSGIDEKRKQLGAAAVFLLHYRRTIRTRNRVKGISLPPPSLSSWSYLYSNGDDESFVSETGLNGKTQRFCPAFWLRAASWVAP
jgi:hypothetical protein